MSITKRSNLYVDPKMYNDVESTLKQFASEINQKSLKIGQLICNGRFADVYKGILFVSRMSKEVAVKRIKVH